MWYRNAASPPIQWIDIQFQTPYSTLSQKGTIYNQVGALGHDNRKLQHGCSRDGNPNCYDHILGLNGTIYVSGSYLEHQSLDRGFSHISYIRCERRVSSTTSAFSTLSPASNNRPSFLLPSNLQWYHKRVALPERCSPRKQCPRIENVIIAPSNPLEKMRHQCTFPTFYAIAPLTTLK